MGGGNILLFLIVNRLLSFDSSQAYLSIVVGSLAGLFFLIFFFKNFYFFQEISGYFYLKEIVFI